MHAFPREQNQSRSEVWRKDLMVAERTGSHSDSWLADSQLHTGVWEKQGWAEVLGVDEEGCSISIESHSCKGLRERGTSA